MDVIKKVCILMSAFAFILGAQAVQAENYPNRPVRMIVPYPPGGSVDSIARVVVERFSENLGQPVIIDNKAGASGLIGTSEAAKSKPDGYTLLMVFDSHAVLPHLFKTQFDIIKSFDYISLLVSAPQVLAVPTLFPANTVPEFIAYAKARPGMVTYGSAGAGTSNHLNALSFSDAAGIETTHVPYKGGGPLLLATMRGEVNFMIGSLPYVEPQVKAGRIKILAVGTKARVPQKPDIPLIGDFLTGYEASNWVGFMAPAGLPKEVAEKVRDAMMKTLAFPAIKQRLISDGYQVIASTPTEFVSRVKADSESLGKLIQSRQIKAD